GKSHQDEFDRSGPFVLGGEYFGVVGIEGERGLAVLFLAEAVEAFDGRVAVRAMLPFARCTPFELRALRSLGKCLARRDQSFAVHAVFDGVSISHRSLHTLAASFDAFAHSLRIRVRPRSAAFKPEALHFPSGDNSAAPATCHTEPSKSPVDPRRLIRSPRRRGPAIRGRCRERGPAPCAY